MGFELRVVGSSPETAKLLGINEEKIVFLAMLLSGGLSGFAGVGEVAGIHHLLRHPDHISLGYGYTAIIVAWLARANPLATIVTSFLFGALLSGGDALRGVSGYSLSGSIGIQWTYPLFFSYFH